jgi:type II restriction enzyme
MQSQNVVEIIKDCLREKFKNYKPETSSMPFHFRLLGKDRMALYSFIQSLNTTFGTSIFELVAVALAKDKFKNTGRGVEVGDKISSKAQERIQKIMDSLTTGQVNPNKIKEIDLIQKASKLGDMVKVKPAKADLFLETDDGVKWFFDIKTAKPNRGNFKEFKRTLLEWAAIVLTQNQKRKLKLQSQFLTIPTNQNVMNDGH